MLNMARWYLEIFTTTGKQIANCETRDEAIAVLKAQAEEMREDIERAQLTSPEGKVEPLVVPS